MLLPRFVGCYRPVTRLFRPVYGLTLAHRLVVRIGILHRVGREYPIAILIGERLAHACPQARRPISTKSLILRVWISVVTLLGRTANFDIAALEKPHCGQMPSRSIGA